MHSKNLYHSNVTVRNKHTNSGQHLLAAEFLCAGD